MVPFKPSLLHSYRPQFTRPLVHRVSPPPALHLPPCSTPHSPISSVNSRNSGWATPWLTCWSAITSLFRTRPRTEMRQYTAHERLNLEKAEAYHRVGVDCVIGDTLDRRLNALPLYPRPTPRKRLARPLDPLLDGQLRSDSADRSPTLSPR